MKKLTTLFLFFIFAYTAYSQEYMYNNLNSVSRNAIVIYQKDARGFYYKLENVSQKLVDTYKRCYAYDKKNKQLYVKGDYANYVVTIRDNDVKSLKKNKDIPKLKGEELQIAIKRVNAELDEKFTQLNAKRQEEIEAAIAKAKADSIQKAREDSISQVRKAEEKELYCKSHSWDWIPVPRTSNKCSLCDKNISINDSILCFGIENDTLYFANSNYLALGQYYTEIHNFAISKEFNNYAPFKKHVEFFNDSLYHRRSNLTDHAFRFNYYSIDESLEKVRKIAPYGYFEDWGWGDEYGFISFYFTYTNTNKNTIKYIDVYWKITNDVNDVRKTGHFKGTGPLGEWKSAKWNWDNSMYYVAGDATTMDITKIIITYMNGTTKVLNKSALHFNYTLD